MRSPVSNDSPDVHAMARELSNQERELSRKARAFLDSSGDEAGEVWFGLVEQAAMRLRRTARELAALPGSAAKSARDERGSAADDAGESAGRTKRSLDDNVLSGHASVATVSEVLGFLSSMSKSGVLWVDLATETFLVQLKEGSVVYAQGDNPPSGQRVGEILVRHGAMTEEGMQAALNAAMESKEVLGAYLVRSETITRAQLAAALTEQAQMIFHRMFGNPEATYQFEDGVHMVDSQDVRLNVIQLLLESARVNDEGQMELEAGVPVFLARCA